MGDLTSCRKHLSEQKKTQTSLDDLDKTPLPTKNFSTNNDWTKVCEKVSYALTEANRVDDDLENTLKSVVIENQMLILELAEREWYKDLFEISNELFRAKEIANFSQMRFDKRRIQIEEHFKFFTTSAVNCIFNTHKRIGTYKMPNKRVYRSRPKIYESSNASRDYIKNYEMLTPEYATAMSNKTNSQFSRPQNFSKPQGIPENNYSNRNSIGSNMSTPMKQDFNKLGGLNGSNKTYCFNEYNKDDEKKYQYGSFMTVLPHKLSPLWHKGFVWKGVYFKLLSPIKAKLAEKMLNRMKYLAVEFYNNDTSKKIILNEGHKDEKESQLHFQLPLINVISTASYAVIACPVVFTLQDNKSDIDFMDKLLTSNACKNYYDSVVDQTRKYYTEANQEEKKNTSRLLMHLQGKNLQSQLDWENLQLFSSSSSGINLSGGPGKLEDNGQMTKQPLLLQYVITSWNFLGLMKSQNMQIWEIDNSIGYLKSEIVAERSINLKKIASWFPQEDTLKLSEINFSRMGSSSLQPLMKRMSTDLNTSEGIIKVDVDEIITSEECVYVFSYSKREVSRDYNAIGNRQLTSIDSGKKHEYYGKIVLLVFKSEPSYFIKPNLLPYKTLTNISKSNKSVLTDIYQHINNNGSGIRLLQPRQNITEQNEIFDNLKRGLDEAAKDITNCDAYYSYNGLNFLQKKKSINKRFEYFLLLKIKDERARNQVLCDILIRLIRQVIREELSQELAKNIANINNKLNAPSSTESMTDLVDERFFIKRLTSVLNAQLKMDEKDNTNQEIVTKFLEKVQARWLFLKSKLLGYEELCDDMEETGSNSIDLIDNQLFEELIKIPYKELSQFIDGIIYHFRINIDYDILHRIRNDKYCLYLPPFFKGFKESHIDSIIYKLTRIFNLREYAFLNLGKLRNIGMSNTSEKKYEFYQPYCFYTIDDKPTSSNSKRQNVLPELDTLNDWLMIIEPTFTNIQSVDSKQSFLIEPYTLIILHQIFENNLESAKNVYDKIINTMNQISSYNPEDLITVYTIGGMILETSALVEAEQQYVMAMLLLQKLYGDPRGRGAKGRAIQLFLCWRQSILCRLQNKVKDAEYIEELFDTILMTLTPNIMSQKFKEYSSFNENIFGNGTKMNSSNTPNRLQDSTNSLNQNFFNSGIGTVGFSKKTDKIENIKTLNNDEDIINMAPAEFLNIPFSHWTQHIRINEGTPKNFSFSSVIEDSLFKNKELFSWLLIYQPIFNISGNNFLS